jgi:hypothetical protein
MVTKLICEKIAIRFLSKLILNFYRLIKVHSSKSWDTSENFQSYPKKTKFAQSGHLAIYTSDKSTCAIFWPCQAKLTLL